MRRAIWKYCSDDPNEVKKLRDEEVTKSVWISGEDDDRSS
jgi:hypothetical protein